MSDDDPDVVCDQIRKLIDRGILKDVHLANLLWEYAVRHYRSPKVTIGTRSDLIPEKCGLVQVWVDANQDNDK